MWFLISIIPPALWALTNHIDKYLISGIGRTKSVSTLIVYSGLIGFPAALVIGSLNLGSLNIGFIYILMSLMAGAIYMCALIAYFRALEWGDASQVVPLFQLSPIISAILGFIFFEEILSIDQILGALVIIIGSIGLSVEFSQIESRILFRKSIFLLMFLSSFLLALQGLLFKYVALNDVYWETSFWMYVGYFVYTLILVSFGSKIRRDFVKDLSRSTSGIVGLNITNEIIAVVGNLLFNSALLLAPMGLVYFVSEGFQPFFVLVLGILITKFFPKLGQENISADHLTQKVLAITLMAVGVYLIAS